MNDAVTKTILTTLDTDSILFAGIFGSRARGDYKSGSDLDLLVRFKEPQGLIRLATIRRQLSEKLGINVDLVTERALSPLLHDEIMRDLKPIYGER